MNKVVLGYRSALLILAVIGFEIDSIEAQSNLVKSGVYNTGERISGSTSVYESFNVSEVILQQGHSSSFLSNESEQLAIVRKGKMKVALNGEAKILGPGSIIFLLPGERHSFESEGIAPASFLLLTFKSKLPMNIERGRNGGSSFMIDWNDVMKKETDKGYRREFFNRATASCAKYEMHVTTLNSGLSSHAPHTHTEEEIILPLLGNAVMEIDGRKVNAPVGSIVFLASGVSHALHNAGNDACEYFAFQWK